MPKLPKKKSQKEPSMKAEKAGKAGKEKKARSMPVVPIDPLMGLDTPSLQAEMEKLSQGDYKSFIEQVESEYQYAWWYIRPKWEEWGLRLRLYNNQRRDKNAVGDPLLFTIFQTVFASLYNDRLSVMFESREDGDTEVAESLNNLAEFDYDEMEKEIVDYEWDWDTAFFGRGLVSMMEFDREEMVPIPEVWDPMTVLRDPDAKSVRGDKKGRGKARFIFREVRRTKTSLEEDGVYFNLGKLKADNGKSINSLVDRNKMLRDEAQGRANMVNWGDLKGGNRTYRLLEGFTFVDKKLVFFTLANDRQTVIRYTELDYKRIPMADRSLFPISHDWDGVSIPDLVEDKQRARAVIMNVAVKSAKSSVNPEYLFNTNKIKNKADLNVEFNKHIGVDGDPTNAVIPKPKDRVQQEVNFIMDMLDGSAQRATATPDIQQGQVTEQKRTLGELELVNKNVDTRYSLSVKIFGWSEKRFWELWYTLYKKYFKDGIDEKTVRISGAMGAKYRPLRRSNIITEKDPDIKIESRVIAEAQRFNDMQKFQGVMSFVAPDPNSNRRYMEREIARLSGMKKDQIDQMLPPTIDEMIAEQENVELEKNVQVNVRMSDDHRMHIEIHNRLSDTPAKAAHINAHIRAMILQKTNPELFPTAPSAINALPGETVQQDVVGKPANNTSTTKSTAIQ